MNHMDDYQVNQPISLHFSFESIVQFDTTHSHILDNIMGLN